MDLRLHLAVLWRFKAVVAGAVLLGIVLAALSVFKLPGTEYRRQEIWSSTSTIYLTQPGFPEGRILAEDAAAGAAQAGTTSESQMSKFGDPARFGSLAILYSYFAMSHEVRARLGTLPPGAEVLNSAVVEGSGSKAATLPLLNIEARATDAKTAQSLNGKMVKAVEGYIKEKQDKNGVPTDERVRLQVINPPSEPIVAVPRSMTGAIVLLFLCTLLGVGLAYLLENLKPRVRPVRMPVDAADDAEYYAHAPTPARKHNGVPQPPPAPTPRPPVPSPGSGGWSAGPTTGDVVSMPQRDRR